jgi:hypothetical protein
VSVQEERELRERLGGLLGGIEPRPAPVGLAVRQGRGIRMRRWVTAAVGLAILAGGAVAVPLVLHAPKMTPPASPRQFSVTVNPPQPNAQHGLIGSGTQDGHTWTVVISGHGNNTMISGIGSGRVGGALVMAGTAAVNIESWGGGSPPNDSETIFGAVRSDVTQVAIILPGGKVLHLTPVRYDGQRYVALVIPPQVPVVRGIAYHDGVELAYSIPYQQAGLDNWWLPSQVGPARFTKTITEGVADGHHWRVVAHFGPWGYCFDVPNGSTCLGGLDALRLTPGHIDQPLTCGGSYAGNGDRQPMIGLAIASPNVRQVVLRLSGGSTERYQAVGAAGVRAFGYLLPYHQTIRSATMYDAAGHVAGMPTDLHC